MKALSTERPSNRTGAFAAPAREARMLTHDELKTGFRRRGSADLKAPPHALWAVTGSAEHRPGTTTSATMGGVDCRRQVPETVARGRRAVVARSVEWGHHR